MPYLKRIILLVLIILSITLLFIWFSPLDYTNANVASIHFLFIVILANWYFFLKYRNTKYRSLFNILSTTFTTIFFVFLLLYLALNKNRTVFEITPIPKTNKAVIYHSYTLFMMGNPRIDISVGYSLFGGYLVWRPNSVTKHGLGDFPEKNEKYIIPEKFFQREGVFILEEEGYIFDLYENKVYKLEKHTSK